MKSLDLAKLDAEITKFAKDRDWDQFHSIKNLTMALNVESGELLEIFQWLKEEDSNDVINNPKMYAKLKEEVADVFIYLLRIAHKTDLDLEQIVLDKIKKNSEKYPVSLSKGNAKKYNEL